MGSRTKKALIVNAAFSGLLLLTAIILFIFNIGSSSEHAFLKLPFFYIGAALFMCLRIGTIMDDEDINNRFVSFLLTVFGFLGAAVCVVFAALFIFYLRELESAFSLAFIFGVIANILLLWLSDAISNRKLENFLECYGFIICCSLFTLIFGILRMYLKVGYVALLLMNLLLASAYSALKRNDQRIVAYIVVGVDIVINVLALNYLGFNEYKIQTDGLYVFYLTCIMFSFLTIAICAIVQLLELFFKGLNEKYEFIMNAFLPIACFVLQYLMFIYLEVALIVTGIMVAIVVVITLIACASGSSSSHGSRRARSGGSKIPTRNEVERYARAVASNLNIDVISVTGSHGDITITLGNARDSYGWYDASDAFMEDLASYMSSYDLSGISIRY
ncbi:MAG: hypothetical protein J1F32_03585 [Erysipelotrichales bacterium]|nr:hypothetical protein [Erysipelotrichales bacterium]